MVDFHDAGYCHRDIRLDNVVRCFNRYLVIDLEVAGPLGERVFWHSNTLPPDVAAGTRGFDPLDDLWQLGNLIRRVELAGAQDGVARQVYDMAGRLLQRDIPSATAALNVLSDL